MAVDILDSVVGGTAVVSVVRLHVARWRSRWLSMAALGGTLACGSVPPPSARDVADANDTGRAVSANSESESAVLRRVGTLPTGSPERVGDLVVNAERPYPAASGRTCRALSVSAASGKSSKPLLACSDGKSWFFVPDVFGATSGSGFE
jgi:hypothetical protein